MQCFDEVVYLEVSRQANFCDPSDCDAQGGVCKKGQCVCKQIGNCTLPCPADCSDHGDCRGGGCVCDPGYTGIDCSLSVACANNCAGHGKCNLETAICECIRTAKGAWFGSGCTQWWDSTTITIRVPATDLSPSGRLVVPYKDPSYQVLNAMGGKIVVPKSPLVPFSVECPVRVDTSGGSARPLEMSVASAFVFKDSLIMTGCHGGTLDLAAFASRGTISLHLLMATDIVLAVNDILVFENPHEVVIVSDIFPAVKDLSSGGNKLTVTVAVSKPTALFHNAGSKIQIGRLSLVPHDLPLVGKQPCLCKHGVCDKDNHCNCFPGWGGESCSVEICRANCSGPARGHCSYQPASVPKPEPEYVMPTTSPEPIVTRKVFQVNSSTAAKPYTNPSNIYRGNMSNGTGFRKGNSSYSPRFLTSDEIFDSQDLQGCICEYGYKGTSCELETGCGHLGRHCGPHATCKIIRVPSNLPGQTSKIEIGQCKCHPGWGGPYCNIQITPRNCSGPANARLINPGRRGPRCECKCGFGGKDCSLPQNCAKSCGMNGICSGGKCHCSRGWGGRKCDIYHCQVDSDCMHGKCTHGVCLCNTGFTGSACECKKPKAGDPITECETIPSLSQQCNTCSGNGARVLFPKPHCKCDPDFEGIMCERRKPCPKNCSGHGTCHAGKCVCNKGFAGVGCQRVSCPRGPGDSGECSGHGICINRHKLDPFSEDSTTTTTTTTSTTAKIAEADMFIYPINPLENASNQSNASKNTGGQTTLPPAMVENKMKSTTAKVVKSTTLSPGSFACFCSPEYSGIACARKNQCPNGCSKHGVCSNGLCECDNGWTSHDCSKPTVCPTKITYNPTRPSPALVAGSSGLSSGGGALHPQASASQQSLECSGHGKCIQGTCYCEPPFSGIDCSRTQVCDEHCSEHGVCQEGVCECNPGFGGPSCDHPVSCPDDCNGHGVCYLGICACRSGL